MERMHRVELAASVLLAAAMVGAIVYAAWMSAPVAPPAPFTPTPSFVLLPRNTSFVLAPGQERFYMYSNATTSNYLAGLFTVTPVGDCGTPCFLFPGIFLMTPEQFAAFQGGGFDGYLSGALYAENVSVFALLAPGTYYVMFWNHEDVGFSNLSLRYTATMPFSGYAATTRHPVPPSPPPRRTLFAPQSIPIGNGYNGAPWVRLDVTLDPTFWNYTISGSFFATGATTTFYVFTPTQFTAFSSSWGAINAPASYPAVFTSGPTAQTAFNASVQPGNYYLVFTNNSVTYGSVDTTSITVDLSQNLTATPK